ncbi:hypothetical protein BH09VER1_BH09VER1_27860 [soil metagenome]
MAAALFLLPVTHHHAAPEADAEMQARSRNCLLNRGTLGMGKLLESPTLSSSQTAAISLLLQELRLEMHLFLDHSDLEGDALQSKLQDLLEVTRYNVAILAADDASSASPQRSSEQSHQKAVERGFSGLRVWEEPAILLSSMRNWR